MITNKKEYQMFTAEQIKLINSDKSNTIKELVSEFTNYKSLDSVIKVGQVDVLDLSDSSKKFSDVLEKCEKFFVPLGYTVTMEEIHSLRTIKEIYIKVEA